ncbi:MAG: heme exporter protein CcmD [Tatlockia sp.]|nr:heme exporter protein CcmD [Tatlockia sp.]
MTQLLHWFAMGGYSFYVWPAYGLVCMVMLINIFGFKLQNARVRKKLQQWFKRQQV